MIINGKRIPFNMEARIGTAEALGQTKPRMARGTVVHAPRKMSAHYADGGNTGKDQVTPLGPDDYGIKPKRIPHDERKT